MFTTDTFAQSNSEMTPAAAQGESVNLMCPVTTDEEVDPSFTIEYDGQTIGFCCKKCRTRFDADPQAYLSELPMLKTVSMTTLPQPSLDENHDDHSHDDESIEAPVSADNHEDDQEHDHATDHGQTADAGSGFNLLPFLGRFHILIIHFPIALLTMGGFFEVVNMLRRKSLLDPIIRIMIAFGALSSIVAVTLGLMNAIEAQYSGTLASILWWHRALGIVAMIAALATWVLVEKRSRIKSESGYKPARIAILSTAMLIAITAHFGGSLVFGWSYLFP